MPNVSLAEILQLSPEERIQLVEDVWDSIAESPEAIPISDTQRIELDRRRAEYQRNPGGGLDWQKVRARLLERT
jgi:putative addiction module component (TIGR02574 family)